MGGASGPPGARRSAGNGLRAFGLAVALSLAMGAAIRAAEGGLVGSAPAPAASGVSAMVPIAGGRYVPLYGDRSQPVEVEPFELDVRPVTNGDFFRFVAAEPEWRRDRVPPLFADADYLGHWEAPLRLGAEAPVQSPVSNVSWFAARAFCEAYGKRLPSLDEWEFAARADEERRDATSDPDFRERILAWYGTRTELPLPEVRSTEQNVWGVWDMHGLVWEWVEDFNSVMVSGASRKDAAGVDPQLFCAGGSVGSVDPGDYAAFMRYALRASTQARHSLQSLGFRCARGGAK